MSGLFGSTTIKGTRITDFSGTTAEVGKAIPFGHGSFPVDGWVGWAPLPPVEHRQVKRQGKGGVKQETFTYTLSYMIMFCKGKIYGYKWIKRNGKVVYTTDPNAPLEDQAYAAKWAQRVNFFDGSLDQLPDSLIESYEGVGNVSGFPGIAGFTIEDEDTTDNGGAPPNYEACVIATPPEAYLTSLPYPQQIQEQVDQSLSVTDGSLYTILIESFAEPEDVDHELAVDGGSMYDPPPAYTDPENLGQTLTVTEGQLITPPPGEMEPEEVEDTLAPTDGSLKVPPLGELQDEALEAGLAVTGGALTSIVSGVSWNTSDASPLLSFANSNLNAIRNAGSNSYGSVRASQSRSATDTGGRYFEVEVIDGSTSPYLVVGVGNASATLSNYVGFDTNGFGYYQETGAKFTNASTSSYGSSYGVNGSVIGVLVKNGKLYFRLAGTWQNGADPIAESGEAFSGLSGNLFPMVSLWRGDSPAHQVRGRFKSADLIGSLPAGAAAWE